MFGLMRIKYLTARQLQLAVWGCCLLISLNSPVMGGISSLTFPLILETKRTILHYRSLDDLENFDEEIDYTEESVFSSLFSSSDVDNLQEKVKKKVDVLFRRVQDILDMRKIMKKVSIKIYRNREEIKQVHAEIYGTARRLGAGRVPRSWFNYKRNTIYINLDDLHEGILAHEMAHSIIDHYLIIRPPNATAEILARYVDTHLFD